MTDISRPENPLLDRTQLTDLKEFFSTLDEGSLVAVRDQLNEDSSRDVGPYKSGGVPANVNKALLAVQEELEARRKRKK